MAKRKLQVSGEQFWRMSAKVDALQAESRRLQKLADVARARYLDAKRRFVALLPHFAQLPAGGCGAGEIATRLAEHYRHNSEEKHW